MFQKFPGKHAHTPSYAVTVPVIEPPPLCMATFCFALNVERLFVSVNRVNELLLHLFTNGYKKEYTIWAFSDDDDDV